MVEVIKEVLRSSKEVKVVIGCGSLSELPKVLSDLRPHKVLVVIDSSIKSYWLPKIEELVAEPIKSPPKVIELSCGEGVKSLSTLVRLWELMIREELTRKSVVVAVGGGTLLDVAGFAASTFMRGCGLVNVPTTLLSQVDACLGGKTGIDFLGKNTVGTYYHADAVIIDPTLLKTLPNHVFVEGISEVVKHAVIGGESYVAMLESLIGKVLSRDLRALEDVIKFSIKVKLSIVRRDYLESGVRSLLNFGHTVGHALERATDWGLSHGHAVSIGLSIESLIANELLNFPLECVNRITSLLKSAGLPTSVSIDADTIVENARNDKKFIEGKPRLPLPRRFGLFELITLDWGEFRECLRRVLRRSV